MGVNDDAGCLNARVVWKSIVGTPPGASSLLQGDLCHAQIRLIDFMPKNRARYPPVTSRAASALA
ncbi:hypothetical protein PS838_04679 [Pseudomonas fluorescens]|nr:hypothetical protein PS838_04679 [Pseudomonas fluorescens]